MKVDTTKFTEAEENRFIEGWSNAGGTTEDLDTPNPWCCPWYWEPIIEVEGNTPEEWGADWWRQCREEVERLMREGEEDTNL